MIESSGGSRAPLRSAPPKVAGGLRNSNSLLTMSGMLLALLGGNDSASEDGGHPARICQLPSAAAAGDFQVVGRFVV